MSSGSQILEKYYLCSDVNAGLEGGTHALWPVVRQQSHTWKFIHLNYSGGLQSAELWPTTGVKKGHPRLNTDVFVLLSTGARCRHLGKKDPVFSVGGATEGPIRPYA